MILEKTIIDNIERCYSVLSSEIDSERCLIVASEKIDGELAYYPFSNLKEKHTIWNDIGGTMSIVAVPNNPNTFYVGTKFYPGFNSKEAGVYCVKKNNNVWEKKEVLRVPYLHRFDIFDVNGSKIFVGCTLCTSKSDKEDWSDPGKVLIGTLNEDVSESFPLTVIKENMLKNHGYWRGKYNGEDVGYIACDDGVYLFTPKDLSIKKVLTGSISEMAVYDIDDCGKDEIVTIEPFHGNKCKIYKLKNDEYKEIFDFPMEIDFAHALWAGNIAGTNTIVLGTRKINKTLFTITYVNNEYVVEEQDQNVGSANVSVFKENNKEYILSANNAIGEVALYKVI